MRIGRRRLRAFRRRLFDVSNYKAIPRFFEVHDRPLRVMVEDAFSLGRYPRTVSIRTPTGRVAPRLFSSADLSTLNLVFCREDYYAPQNIRAVVDIGSNIGLSALYWLTRNTESYVYCHEPAPMSYERLAGNVAPFKDRVTVRCVAVSDFQGEARLGIEKSGVNSSLELASAESVACAVIHINDVLKPVLERHGQIDVLKIDSEGHEFRTLQAIAPEYWPRIRCVNIGCHGAAEFVPQAFRYSRVASAERFSR